MVHRTDIAGSVGCSRGQVNPGNDGICRHAPSGALIEETVFYRKSLPLRTSTARSAAVSSLTALPLVHAIYVETLGPMKR